MKAKIWGMVVIAISIAMLVWFAWAWLWVALPDSNIWKECQDYFGTSLVLENSMILDGITDTVIIFFVPMTIVSLISNILLIRTKKAKTWGKWTIVGSFVHLILFAIFIPGLVIYACKGAEFAIIDTIWSFFILSITSLISGIVLVKTSKRI